MLKINENIIIKRKEIKYRAIKSSGPGGQNINKNSTAVCLYFDISKSRSLSDQVKAKLINTPNKYLTNSGKIGSTSWAITPMYLSKLFVSFKL